MSDLPEENYKSLLIVNESSDAWVTLYLYPTWDFICWLSVESKIIKPNGGKYLHRSSKGFKFKLVARFRDGRRSKQTLQKLEEWDEDKLLKITSSLEFTEEKLEDFSIEKRVCLRKAQRDKELKCTNGAAGGAVTKSVVGIEVSAASANIEGEIGEQPAILTGAKRLGKILAQRIPRALTQNGTEAVMGSVAQFTEERLDHSVENRNPGQHLVEGVQNVAVSTVKGLAQETGGAIGLHLWNESKIGNMVNKEHSQQFITPLIDDDASVEGPRVDASENEQITYGKVRKELSEENNEHRINWRSHSKNPFSYQPLVPGEPSSHDDQGANLSTIFEEDAEDDQSEVNDKAEDCKVKYISEGAWASKMVVSYFLKGERITQEVRGSGKSVTIPGNATQLEVKFQVMRPFWGDLKKYDRFKRCWCNPDQAHVFKFNTPPPLRTFTISGRLWYEAIMTVSDEYHDETKEM